MKKAKDVDSYIKSAPKEVQAKLNQIRGAIKSSVPNAEEKISYGMPYYGYKGRLVYFAYSKNHLGVYAMSPAMKKHEKEVKRYKTGKATLQFSYDKKLPIDLIKKLVKTQVNFNEAKEKKNE